MTVHKSVLPKESIDSLNLKEGAIVVDATLGGGGHSRSILEKIGDRGKLVAIDLDKRAIENFRLMTDDFRPSRRENIFLINDNFANLGNILNSLGIEKVDAILADLGWSSDQMEDTHRGLSFLTNAPLDMRLNQSQELTAKKVVNDYSQEKIEEIIRHYGEEKFSRQIARKVIDWRTKHPIDTTQDLVAIIAEAVPEKYKHGKIHYATRTFQALRIEVNKELEKLEEFIPEAIDRLSPAGRLAIISFHSLEDRIVKNIFKDKAGGCVCPVDFPQCVCGRKPIVKIITKKPIIPREKEINENPRARSAKMRVAEKM